MTTRFWTTMASLGLLCGCGDVPTAVPEAVEEHVSERTEGRPHEPDGHELKAGAVDCSARTDTGYVSGSPFAISTVVVDGKPVEIDTANAYTVMQREAAADGIFLQVISGFLEDLKKIVIGALIIICCGLHLGFILFGNLLVNSCFFFLLVIHTLCRRKFCFQQEGYFQLPLQTIHQG